MSERTPAETTVLVVDPDRDARERTVGAVRDALADVTVREADALSAAREALDDLTGDDGAGVDAVVTEYDLGDGTGLDLAAHLRDVVPGAGCILYTATTEVDTASFEETVVEYVPKVEPGSDGGDGPDPQLAAALEATTVDHSQTAYPLPDDEAGRLAAVERYVDGADPDRVDASLDRIVEVAATHFGVEVASVTVVREHEQELLATSGPGAPPTPRDDSICTYTILEERTMAVEDTREDGRFADNEALRAAGVRAYLGAAIRTPDGHSLGALCLYDDRPRSFSPADREVLATLADLAMDVLVLGGDEA